jgi:competence protein ComEC
MFFKKLLIRSKYKFFIGRFDFISIYIFSILIGLYIGGISLFESLIFVVLTITVILFIIYKAKEYFVLICFIAAIIIGTLIFSFTKNTKYILDGEFSYISTYKIVTIDSGKLWYKEKLQIEDEIFIPASVSNLYCEEVNFKGEVEDAELLNQGIRRKISCTSKWRYYSKSNMFSQINELLSKRFDSFSKDIAELLKGITLGIRPSKDLSNDFKNVGLSHILVISGFNITLIITIIIALTKKLYTLIKVFLTLVFVILFVLVVGPTPPVLRAGFMGIIGFLASIKWRDISYMRLLLLSSLIMIFIDPYTTYSISFHLSFLATLGIILFNQGFSYILNSLPSLIKEILSQTLAASFLTIPYTINIFNSFSFVFLISNLLVLPSLSFLTIISYIYLLIPIKILGEIIQWISTYIIQITFFLGQFSNSFILLDSHQKNILNIFFLICMIFIAIFYLYQKNMLYKRIEKMKYIQ